jgi:hypothetical protein
MFNVAALSDHSFTVLISGLVLYDYKYFVELGIVFAFYDTTVGHANLKWKNS